MQTLTALVTGSSAGLGLAMAERLAADGYRVAVNSRDPGRAAAAARRVGHAAVAVAGDVARPDEAERVVAEAVDALGRLDLLVNNAGIAAEAPSADLALEEWDAILATNLTGALICARDAAAHMAASGGGTIVNVGSLWANFGMPERAAYATTKHGLHGLTAHLTRAWSARGVRAVTIDPGYIATAMVDGGVAGGGESQLAGRAPLGRLGTAREVADAVAFLARTPSVGGVSLRVDGGWMAYGGW